jgi:hypothetical protein
MTLPAHFWRRFPRRVVHVRNQESWLPDELPLCTYAQRHQIMRENYRYSMASKLFYDVLRDLFDGDVQALARALEELRTD